MEVLSGRAGLHAVGDSPNSESSTQPGSCTTCAKAKSRCRRQGNGKCERCARLNKECHKREPVVRRRKAKATSVSQMKHLETKLDLIAQALATRTSQEASTSSDTGVAAAPLPKVTPYQDAQEIIPPLLMHQAPELAISSGPASSSRGSQEPPIVRETEYHASHSLEDEALLSRYRRLMAQNMPFVVLSPGLRASDLATHDPILMHAIRVVASFHDSSKQKDMAKSLIRNISETLLVRGEKSLGLLQGMLVFLNWYHYHLYAPQNSTNLLHLAIALTTDLNIDRGPGRGEKERMNSAMRAYGVAGAPKTLSNAERRAVLGTFYLNSQTSIAFRKVDPLHWSPWLEECARALSEAKEYESDHYLVQLVHMQRIMQEASAVEYTSAPYQLYATSFLNDLEMLGMIHGSGSIYTILQLQAACTRIAIWQRSFAGIVNEDTTSNLRHRLDGMWRCMEAVRTYMNIYMELPVQDYVLVPFGVFAQFAWSFVVLIRAHDSGETGWDASALHQLIDLSDIAEKASQRYEAVAYASPDGITLENQSFSNWGSKLRLAKAFHDARNKSALINPICGTINAQDGSYVHTGTLAGSMPSAFAMDSYLPSYLGFEDFWMSSNDWLQAPVGLGLESNEN